MATATAKKPASARLEARMTPELLALTKRAAAIKHQTVTEFTTEVLLAASTAVVEATDLVRLSLSDQQAFANALFNPPEPNAALRKAFDRHHKLVVNRE